MPPPSAEFIDTAVGMTIGRLAIQIELRMGIFAERFPSPLVGESGSHERSECETGEGALSLFV